MLEALRSQNSNEATEQNQMLSKEAFIYNTEGKTPQEVQPFNNFYFYFLDEDAGGMFYEIYRGKPWFKDFAKQNATLLQTTTETITQIQTDTDLTDTEKLIHMGKSLYEAYRVAHTYASNEELFK